MDSPVNKSKGRCSTETILEPDTKPMKPEVLNEIFERASVSGDPDIRTCASAILEYRLVLDKTIEEIEYLVTKIEHGQRQWAITRLKALAETLREYSTPQP